MPVAGTVTGSTDTNAVANGTLNGNSAYGQPAAATTAGTHYHGGGTLSVFNSNHYHTNSSSNQAATVPVSYDTATLTISPLGTLTLANCPAAATELSFCEHLPLA